MDIYAGQSMVDGASSDHNAVHKIVSNPLGKDPALTSPDDAHPVPSDAARSLVAGAYDTHVHIAPDVMDRRIDDLSLAARFAQVGLAGFVIKSHYVTTAERAAVVT